MMWYKINPNLIKNIKTLELKQVECVLYAHDYFKLGSYLKKKYSEIFPIPFIGAYVLKIPYENIFELSQLNVVKYITESARVSTFVNVANKILNLTDKSVIPPPDFSIAVIDTGIYPHLDFVIPRNKIIKFVDLINGKTKPYDDNGHGTFVCGAIAGNGTVNPKFVGIDPKTNLVVIKALDKNGETGASTILNAMQWVFDHKEEFNIRAVCMSFGSIPLGKNDPLKVGAEKLWDSGIAVVSAGGNSGPDPETIRSPGISHKIITVGALNDERIGDNPQYDKFKVAEFSSRGPIYNVYKPDLIASGVNINGLNNDVKNGFYTIMSGTSVSTPIVVGAVSVIIKKHPNYSPDQIKKILIDSCTKINGDRNSEGFGWLDGKKLFIN